MKTIAISISHIDLSIAFEYQIYQPRQSFETTFSREVRSIRRSLPNIYEFPKQSFKTTPLSKIARAIATKQQ